MPNTREKLIKLICSATDGCGGYCAGTIADHLIVCGVTFKEQGATMQKWIPVTEKLPDRNKVIDGDVYYKNVAVRVKNLLHERIAYYDPEHECWYDTGFFQLRGVTHWAELPDWGDFAE